MNTTVNIRLGKKDSQLIEWWDEMAKEDYNISRTIYLAILYYIHTGEYLTIAQMKKSENQKEGVIKKLYLQKDTEVFNWLSQKQEQKISVSQLIRGILKQSIEYTQDKTVLVEIEKLILLTEEAATKSKSNRLNAYSKYTEVQPYKERPGYQEKESMERSVSSAIKYPVSEKKEALNESYETEEYENDEFETDLVDMLIGGNPLVL